MPKGVVAHGNLIDGVGENMTKGNLVQKALFVDGAARDFWLHRRAGIDAGFSATGDGTTDPAGKPRVRARRINIGAYERQRQGY